MTAFGIDRSGAAGGTGSIPPGSSFDALTDPGADRIVFWDDSAGIVNWLALGSGLVISGTTLSLDSASLITLAALTISSGPLTVSAGGISAAGGLTISSGTTSLAGQLTVASGGLVVSAGTTSLAGQLTVASGGVTIALGGLTVSSGNVLITASLGVGGGVPTAQAIYAIHNVAAEDVISVHNNTTVGSAALVTFYTEASATHRGQISFDRASTRIFFKGQAGLGLGVDASGHVYASTNATQDLGALGATWRSGYFASSIVTPVVAPATGSQLRMGSIGDTNSIFFVTNNIDRWGVSGTSGSLLPILTNAYDIGAVGNTVRTGYFETSLITGFITGSTTSGNALGGAAASASTVLNLPAGTTSVSTLRLAAGVAPTSPVQGDIWATSAGVFARLNNVTVDLAAASAGGITLGAEVVATSGASIDFTGIPVGTKRVTIMGRGISMTGTHLPIAQIGTSGGIQTTTYTYSTGFTDVSGAGGANHSSGILLTSTTLSSSQLQDYTITLCLQNSSSNLWAITHQLGVSNAAVGSVGAGGKALGAPLDRVRLTSAAGTETFDAGEFNITYE